MDILPKIWPKFPETCSKQAWNEHSSLMEIPVVLNIDEIVWNSD